MILTVRPCRWVSTAFSGEAVPRTQPQVHILCLSFHNNKTTTLLLAISVPYESQRGDLQIPAFYT